MKRFLIIFVLLGAFSNTIFAQEKINYDSLTNREKDSLYIFEVEDKYEKDKVLHAEPLYIDLIRDLGARKGEREWNFGIGVLDERNHDRIEALVEYEFAPIDRLGLEIEVPLSLYSARGDLSGSSRPNNRMESLKLAGQWSFFVSEKIATSMAIGYIHEFELSDFKSFGRPLFKGNIYNPFLIVAKRWGRNFHSLVYTGPAIHQEFAAEKVENIYEMHTNFHYMITGTRNFIGMEVNKYWDNGEMEMTFRPQMRVGLAHNLLVGIVAGIPYNNPKKGFSSFLRVIWEPSDLPIH